MVAFPALKVSSAPWALGPGAPTLRGIWHLSHHRQGLDPVAESLGRILLRIKFGSEPATHTDNLVNFGLKDR